MSRSILIVDSFYGKAKALREHFDHRFADPRAADGGRFVWDYWNVPDQYTLLRTPAYAFFPKGLYGDFHRSLVQWGRETLGCHDISPPWLSCYVEGCGQELHGDLPHGPWAFVLSLTRWGARRFEGGETMILRDPMLSFWRHYRSGRGMERGEILRLVPARFNRLVVFDPRIPHGVRRVQGARDVREGRLVLHGWFVQPRPFIRGPLPPKTLQSGIDGLSARLKPWLSTGARLNGVLCLRFQVASSGSIAGVRLITNSLRSDDPRVAAALAREAIRYWSDRRFERQRGVSTVTLPLIFESER